MKRKLEREREGQGGALKAMLRERDLKNQEEEVKSESSTLSSDEEELLEKQAQGDVKAEKRDPVLVLTEQMSPIKVNIDEQTIPELSEEQNASEDRGRSLASAFDKIPTPSMQGSQLDGLSGIKSEIKEET